MSNEEQLPLPEEDKDKRIAELEQELATAKKALEDTTADYLSLLDINKTMEGWLVHCKAELNAYKRKEQLPPNGEG